MSHPKLAIALLVTVAAVAAVVAVVMVQCQQY
jgi:hypothetical protein